MCSAPRSENRVKTWHFVTEWSTIVFWGHFPSGSWDKIRTWNWKLAGQAVSNCKYEFSNTCLPRLPPKTPVLALGNLFLNHPDALWASSWVLPRHRVTADPVGSHTKMHRTQARSTIPCTPQRGSRQIPLGSRRIKCTKPKRKA